MENEDHVVKVHVDQLEIEVPPAPGAIGKWGPDQEFSAYRQAFGDEKALEQKRLADEAKTCKCGKQAQEDAKAREEDRRPMKLQGHKHAAGCPLWRALPDHKHTVTEEDVERGFA
jgi:hypothetical protein